MIDWLLSPMIDQLPELPTLYSFRRCPYAIRARMALAASGQSVVLREVLLNSRPRELYQRSAKGTVPVLVLADEQVIDESWNIMLWALSCQDPNHLLDGIGEAKELVVQNDQRFKEHLDKYKYSARHPEESKESYRAQGEEFLRQLDQRLKTRSFLCGRSLTVIDVAIFPFIRQFAHVDKDWFFQTPYKQLHSWLNGLLESELFLSVMEKYKAWEAHSEPVIFPPKMPKARSR
jgi:glutathione S-transferase